MIDFWKKMFDVFRNCMEWFECICVFVIIADKLHFPFYAVFILGLNMEQVLLVPSRNEILCCCCET